MRRLTRMVLAVQLACLAGVASRAHAAPAASPSRLALVIGNGAYNGLPPISSCIASAHVVTAALQRAGYTVTERLNESNGSMGAVLSDFADALSAAPGGAAVVYVCGYAVGFDGRVFLLPVTATLERPTDVLTQGLVGRIAVNTVVRSQALAGLVLLDAVAAPGSSAAIPFGRYANEKEMENTGFVAVGAATPPPDGPTTLAAALSAAFAQPTVELKATVQALQAAFLGPAAMRLVVHEPGQLAYLAGTPPPVAAQAPVAAAPSAAAASTPDAPAAEPPATTGAPPAAPTLAVLNPADRRRVQLALQRLGYFGGRVSGTFGYDSLSAIRRFQTESGSTPTGRLTTDQVAHLLDDGR